MSRYSRLQSIRTAARGAVNPLIVRAARRSQTRIEDALVVCGAPRSGTTWLAELLLAIPDTALAFEPLHPKNCPAAKAAGFDWLTYLSQEHGDATPDHAEYVARILQGRNLSSWALSYMPMRRAFRPKHWIVKSVRANLMMGWLAAQFPIRRPVMIVRHPCAMVSSYIRQGWNTGHFELPAAMQRDFPEYQPIIDAAQSPVQRLAARWSVLTRVPLLLGEPLPFQVVFYEHLVMETEPQLRRILDSWQLPFADSLLRKQDQPSQKATNSFRSPRENMKAWKDKMSAQDIATVLDTIEQFNVDFYDDGEMPVVSKLRSDWTT